MMKKIIRVLVLVCIVVCCCTACDKNMEGTTITTIQTEEICASYDPIAMEKPLRGLIGKTVYHNGYMFFFETVESESAGDLYSVKRLNLLTGEISSPCKDPLCTHLNEDCPFVCGGMGTPMIQFFDQYILVHSQFRDYSLAEHSRYKRILYNEKTGEWKEIFQTVSSNTNSKNAFCIDLSVTELITFSLGCPCAFSSIDLIVLGCILSALPLRGIPQPLRNTLSASIFSGVGFSWTRYTNGTSIQ